MCPTLSDTATTKNTYFGKCKSYATSDTLWETFYDQGVMDTSIHKSKYHRAYVYWSIKINAKGGNITIVYTMVAYKSKVIHVEDYTLNFSPIRQNTNGSPSKDTNCGDDSSTSIPDDWQLWDTVIPENTDLSSNKKFEIRDSVLSPLHISGTK